MSTATALVTTGQWSRTGLDLPEGTSFEDWLSVGERLRAMEQSVWWWIGDWLRFGEGRYGEMYAQAMEETGFSYSQLSDAKYIAKAYEPSERLENLPWSHHYVVAKLPIEERRELLARAEREHLSVRDLRTELVRRAVGLTNQPEAPNGFQTSLPDRMMKRTHRVVLAAFSDWFGMGDEYARILMALYQAGGKSMTWQELSRAVSTHSPMARGAVQEAIHSLRGLMEAEAIDRDDDGYSLTEVGFAECRNAFRELGRQLLGMGAEPANDAGPVRSLEVQP